MPDSVDSIFSASAMVFTGEVFHMNTMLMSESVRPIQLSSAVLKRTPWVPSFSSSGAVGAPMPITEPSLCSVTETFFAPFVGATG